MLKAASVKDNFQQNDSYEEYQYFYHPDHLGSSSFITSIEGEVVQHIEYVPYGEVFIEERNNVWNTPYLFNAKEFDEETGLYYNGARYYDARLALWYGVDALAERHPDASPYLFCFNRPINRIDYYGRDTTIYVFDQADRPLDNGVKGKTYTADVYVDKDGTLVGPYSGSSYPN